MGRILRSTKITIAEDPSTSIDDTPQKYEERSATRFESRAALEPIDNVTETVVVSVDEANEADEEKLLKAAFKSAIGIKKKKKPKRDRKTKNDSSEQVSGETTPEENAAIPHEDKTPETDNDKLQHLLKDLQDTHITGLPAEPAQDITLIRNVPTGPARSTRSRSQHNNVHHAQTGQYIPPCNYHYPPHGGMSGPPPWARGPGYGHYRPPAPIPYPTHHNSYFGGFRGPDIFAGPPPPVLRGGYMNGHDQSWHQHRQQRQIEEKNSLEQVQKWLSESTPEVVHKEPVANVHWRKVEEPKQQEPIYVYTGASRYVSNSTIEISAGGEETNDESVDDAPVARAEIAETADEVEAEDETQIDAQVEAQIQQNNNTIETGEEEPPAYTESEHDIEETEKASAAEVKAVKPTKSETEPTKDEPAIHVEEPATNIEEPWHDEDSFIHHIVERSPAKPARRRSSIDEDLKLRFQSRPGSAADLVDNLEKFEDIITRSPAKPVSRIEDSLEKLDMDEDLMVELAEVVSGSARGSPAKGNSPAQSPPTTVIRKKVPITPAPVKSGTLRRAATATGRPTPASASVGLRGGRALVSRMTADKATAGTATVRAKAPVPRQSVMAAAAAHRRSASVASGSVQSKDSPFSIARPLAKRPTSLLPPKIPVKAARAPNRPSFELPGEKVARELREKREAREARMAQRDADTEKVGLIKRTMSNLAPAVRSSKPPTKPSFELPGDALSRKKREEHQAKLKAEEEAERKRREFKARPVRKSVVSATPAMAPRETAASLARKSIVGHAAGDLTVGKRTLRPSIAEIDHDNVVHSAPRTRVSSKTFDRKSSFGTKPVGTSMSGLAMQRTPSDAAPKKLNGKDIYKRDACALENAEEERKAKQDAAKKAREAAAERGRQASKEWAEKQRKKMMDGKIADPGMHAGARVGEWLTKVEVEVESPAQKAGERQNQKVRVEVKEMSPARKKAMELLRTEEDD